MKGSSENFQIQKLVVEKRITQATTQNIVDMQQQFKMKD